MTAPVRVGVVGATGYAGFELARLLLRHPRLEKPAFFLRNGLAGTRCLTELFPQLRGWGEAACQPFSLDAVMASGAQVVLLATPHEASVELAPPLVAAGLSVIDLSGAFRFRSAETFSHWYKSPPPPQWLLQEATYGLPELGLEQRSPARLVANPGCYATSVILGLVPLVDGEWLVAERGIVCDCKSGVSGAGKQPKPETHFVEVNENFRAYGLFHHRHTPEIAEHLGIALEHLMFAPHLLPIERGILSTLYVWLNQSRGPEEIEALYRRFYDGRRMVRICVAGQVPELQHVVRTNFCDIGFALSDDGQRLVVVSCLDNLGKGAAGQAVQNLNAMMGCEDSEGLL